MDTDGSGHSLTARYRRLTSLELSDAAVELFIRRGFTAVTGWPVQRLCAGTG